jgi:hypothetical protein
MSNSPEAGKRKTEDEGFLDADYAENAVYLATENTDSTEDSQLCVFGGALPKKGCACHPPSSTPLRCSTTQGRQGHIALL